MTRRLFVRANNWVGDLVMATPVLEAVLSTPAWGEVTILVKKPLVKLLEDGPLAERAIGLERGSEDLAVYRRERPDGVLLLSNSLGAALRARRAGVPVRAGAALSGRRLLLTHSLVPATRDGRRLPIPTAHLIRDVAGLVGVLTDDLHPRLHVRDELRRARRQELEQVGLGAGAGYVLCCPGAAFGSAKLWPAEHFAFALDRLYEEEGLVGVLSGAPSEDALMDAVAARCTHPVVSLSGRRHDLASLKALVAGAELVLVGDSGPRWIAAAFDVPCVTLVGPNFPELTATSLERARVLRVEGLECSPCQERACPLGHHRCMVDLAPERAVAAARELLAARPARSSAGTVGVGA